MGRGEMKKEIARYQCIGDSGREYTVIEFQHIIRTQLKSGPPQDVLGTKECFLSDGRDVNFVDDNTFQIVRTDEFVRKIG
jgi:hypothetical protein